MVEQLHALLCISCEDDSSPNFIELLHLLIGLNRKSLLNQS
jgi:hypothetical protein